MLRSSPVQVATLLLITTVVSTVVSVLVLVSIELLQLE